MSVRTSATQRKNHLLVFVGVGVMCLTGVLGIASAGAAEAEPARQPVAVVDGKARPTWGVQALSPEAGAAWLKRISEAPRQLNYEGVFIYRHGDAMQTVRVTSRVLGGAKESRLVTLDGTQREIRCTKSGSVSLFNEGGGQRTERRFSNRHFPDIFPNQAERLVSWYAVSLGGQARVAGQDCQEIILTPKDAFRWGYYLCADKKTGLPLKAVMVNDRGAALMEHAFAEVHVGSPARTSVTAVSAPDAVPEMKSVASGAERLSVKNLPPGFTKVGVMKRKLPNRSGEVEHWVFSDGLTHISLFIEPAAGRIEPMKGESQRGMVNLLTRRVGDYQATVLGEAPWPAVEAIGLNLAESRP